MEETNRNASTSTSPAAVTTISTTEQPSKNVPDLSTFAFPTSSSSAAVIPVESGGNDVRLIPGVSGTWLCCMPCSWLRRNSSFHKASLTVATLLVTSLLVASPVLFLISSVPEGGLVRDCFPQMQEKCTYDLNGIVHSNCDGATCKTLAAQILSSMDLRVPPCQDFYKHACGSPSRFHDNRFTVVSMQSNVNFQLQNLLIFNTTSSVFEKLGEFYNSCLSSRQKINELYKVLDELGGYLPPSSLGPNDLTPLLTQLFEANGSPLFDIYMDYDEIDRTRMALFIDFPQKPILPHRRLLDHQNKIIKELLKGFLPKKMSESQHMMESQSIINFIVELDKLRTVEWTQIEKINFTKVQQDFQFIQWDKLFEDVLSINITDFDNLYVVSPNYLSKVEQLIARFNKRIIHNALLLVYGRDVLYGMANISSDVNLASFCVEVTANVFSQEMGVLYLRQYPNYFIHYLTNKVSALFVRLKRALAERMKVLNWMDGPTRKAALSKLKAMREQYLIWPSLFNSTAISDSLKNVHVDPSNFFGNVVDRFRQLQLIHRTQPNHKLKIYPYSVNVYYKPRENILAIPISLITQAYLRDDIPEYITHASIGTIFMHAILHGFDLHGINYDANGNKTDWFSPESRLGLEARIDCFARQYAKYFIKNRQDKKSGQFYQFNWNTTRNENMADIGGLETAYQTWRNYQKDQQKGMQSLIGINLIPKQLFFVIAAQMYCIYKPSDLKFQNSVNYDTANERVNSIMMNSPAFSEAFNCPFGSHMNPTKKCSTW